MLVNIMALCCIGICLVILAIHIKTTPKLDESEEAEKKKIEALCESYLVPQDRPVLMADAIKHKTLKELAYDKGKKVVSFFVRTRNVFNNACGKVKA